MIVLGFIMLCSLSLSWFCLICNCFYKCRNVKELDNKYEGKLEAIKKTKYDKNIENNVI